MDSWRGCEDNEVAAESEDRLSELPDSLILEILSLLPMRDVVGTTILSKRWNNRWIAVPNLDFQYDHLFDLHSFQSFVHGALAQWNGPKVLKFAISSPHFLPHRHDLDSWLLFAIEKQVEEMSLFSQIDHETDSEYFPPQQLYSCSWIAKLSFYLLKLEIEVENVQWDRLKSLTIQGVDCLSPDALSQILRGAPLLEEFDFFFRIVREKEFTIRSNSLKTLSIAFHPEGTVVVSPREPMLSVWAPNLLSLKILGNIEGGCLLDVPSLTSAQLFLVECDRADFSPFQELQKVYQSICHAENVKLLCWSIKFLLYIEAKGVFVQFSNVTSLHLTDVEPANDMLDVLHMFPKLMFLTVELFFPEIFPGNYSLATDTTASLDHLKTVEISWQAKSTTIFRVIEILLGNARVLEKMVIWLWGEEETFVSAQAEVMDMGRSSPNAEVIIINECKIYDQYF